MIESIKDPHIWERLNDIYNLDIDGFVNNHKDIRTLNFDYNWPVVSFMEPIFMPLFEDLDSKFIYLTKGYNITRDEIYSKFHREDFMDFIRGIITHTPQGRSMESIDLYYMLGMTVFDETFEWLIHNNVDVGYLSFSYQIEKFNKTEILNLLINNKWLVHY